jgi:beta-glucosidase
MSEIKLKFSLFFLGITLIFFNTYSQENIYDPSEKIIASFEKTAENLISRMTIEEKASQMLSTSRALPSHGIEMYNWWNEALHGVARSAKATVFPQAIAMAATFDPQLILKTADAISTEARAMYNIFNAKGMRTEYTGLTFWSPNINIFRDPRWGRGHETYGEDPFLTGQIGSAFVYGLQGNHPKYLKVAAGAKHFAVHSGPESKRHSFNAKVSDQDLYETYLPAFKQLVNANVEIVMCAYNRLNDEPCCGSSTLLNGLLRKNWGFKGHVVSDCGAIYDIKPNHNYTHSDEESVAFAIKGGVDLNCGSLYNLIPSAIEKGFLSELDLNKSLKRLLMTRMKLGILKKVDDNPYDNLNEEVIHCDKHIEIARNVAANSIVLLKNEKNILPLSKDVNRLFITGPNAANVNTLLGNYNGLSSNIVTPLEGIISKVSNGTIIRFNKGVDLIHNNNTRMESSASQAGSSDVTIAVMGISALIEGEEGDAVSSDANGDRNQILLPESQIKYLKSLRKSAGNKPIVLVVKSGSAIDLSEIYGYVDAIIYAWYLGEQGGNAIADIIFGDVNPSGKLPITIPKSLSHLPEYDDYSMNNRTYRFTRHEPMFPFGFGLSYSNFIYSNLSINKQKIKSGDSIELNFEIHNDSEFLGEEVIQLYIKDMESSFRTPNSALKFFKRIKLKPGEKTRVNVLVNKEMYTVINEEGKNTIENGYYKIFVGGSSPCDRSNELGKPIQEVSFKVQ